MQKTKARSKVKATSKVRAAKKPISAIHTPLKHAKHIVRKTPIFIHGMVAGVFVGLLVVGVLRNSPSVNALSLNVWRDCTANAVIYCGALSTGELQQRYWYKGVPEIFSHFGISAGDISAIDSTTVIGTAYKDGTIKIDSTGEVVATGSTSAGRQRIASNSTYHSAGGVGFYMTPSTTAFAVNSLKVYVSMKNGQFDFAIIPNCGNPMMATAVPKPPPPPPTPTPTPPPKPPPAPPPTPEPPIPPVVTSLPEPPPPPPEVKTAAIVETLPQTGAGAIAIIAIVSVVSGSVFHATHRHIRRKRRLRHAARHIHPLR